MPAAQPAIATYRQPTKEKVRREALAHAVALVTNRRADAAVVGRQHVRRVREALRRRNYPGDAHAVSRCLDCDVATWEESWDEKVGSRKTSKITVAYLSGPEPSNDLRVLMKLGIRPENI